MRKLTLTLALVLCLVLCAFAFASCGGSKTKSTTAQETTPSTTVVVGCDHVWNTEYTVDVNPSCIREGAKSIYCTKCGAMKPDSTVSVDKVAHTPAADYTVDTDPNCSDKGYKSKHCTVCGAIIADTVVEIDPIADAHVVLEWDTVNEPTLLSQEGSRTGTCSVCHNPVTETLKFEPIVRICDGSSTGAFKTDNVDFEDVQGDKHFYPNDVDAKGNDLLIEYSVLWNETMLNLSPLQSKNTYVTTRVTRDPIVYWSTTNDMEYSDSKYAGSFEWTGNFTVPIHDSEVNTPDLMFGDKGDYADYPNLGGDDENNPEYGWHRVQIRVHQELIDEDALKLKGVDEYAELSDYVATVTCYVDGVCVFKCKTNDKGMQHIEGNLFLAKSDGQGGIVYEDNDAYVVAFYLNNTTLRDDSPAYAVIADVSVTCGQNFVQNVEKVDNPAAANLVIEDAENENNNTTLSAPIYYKLK